MRWAACWAADFFAKLETAPVKATTPFRTSTPICAQPIRESHFNSRSICCLISLSVFLYSISPPLPQNHLHSGSSPELFLPLP